MLITRNGNTQASIEAMTAYTPHTCDRLGHIWANRGLYTGDPSDTGHICARCGTTAESQQRTDEYQPRHLRVHA